MIHGEKYGGEAMVLSFLTYTKKHTEKATSLLLLDIVMFSYFHASPKQVNILRKRECKFGKNVTPKCCHH